MSKKTIRTWLVHPMGELHTHQWIYRVPLRTIVFKMGARGQHAGYIFLLRSATDTGNTCIFFVEGLIPHAV